MTGSCILLLLLTLQASSAAAKPRACDADATGVEAAKCAMSGQQSLLQVKQSGPVQVVEGDEDIITSQAVQEALTAGETQGVSIAGGEMEDPGKADDAPRRPRGDDAPKQDPGKGDDAPKQDPGKGEESSEGPSSGSCTPLCKWACTSPICEEECTPECAPPKCETRCETVELAGCKLECDQPECCTICPKNKPCAKHGCPSCTTSCSNPVCKLKCPQQQNCKAICESPNCRWKCKHPESCPKPQCRMECETPKKDCSDSIREKLPPLRKGELKVATFSPPSSFLQVSPGVRHAAGSLKGQDVLVAAVVETADGEARIVELPVSP